MFAHKTSNTFPYELLHCSPQQRNQTTHLMHDQRKSGIQVANLNLSGGSNENQGVITSR